MNDRIIYEWQTRWTNSDKGRVTHGFMRKVDFAMNCVEFKPNMYLLFILTGHGSMNDFLCRSGVE